jgi:hypothetical protein
MRGVSDENLVELPQVFELGAREAIAFLAFFVGIFDGAWPEFLEFTIYARNHWAEVPRFDRFLKKAPVVIDQVPRLGIVEEFLHLQVRDDVPFLVGPVEKEFGAIHGAWITVPAKHGITIPDVMAPVQPRQRDEELQYPHYMSFLEVSNPAGRAEMHTK